LQPNRLETESSEESQAKTVSRRLTLINADQGRKIVTIGNNFERQ
jgi:hypothetical protein